MLKLTDKININNNFISAIFVKNTYYFLNNNKEVYIYDLNLNLKKIIKTEYQFSDITFNSNLNKFIASTKETFNRLYILNNNLEIISVFDLKIPKNLQTFINDIIYDENKSNYTITTNKFSFEVDEFGNFKKIITKKFLMLSTFNNYITINKNNSVYLSKISKNGNIIENFYIDDDKDIKILKISNNILELLINNKKESYIYKYKIINENLNILEILYDNEQSINNYISHILKNIKYDNSIKNINYLLELEKISNKNLNLLLDISKNLRL